MILKPPRYDPRARLPTVVLIHGGPASRFADRFNALGQMLATTGHLVFMPNIRGSTGYSYEFMTLPRNDWGFGDYKDVMAGLDHLVKSGIADGERLAIAGWSYGGYMVVWAVTQSDRFKAAVAGAGLSNLISEFGTEAQPWYDEWYFGLPWEHPERFLRSSPLTHVAKARTPTLLTHGAEDVVDPLAQSEEFYRALKHYGGRTELVVYPREGHDLQERAHLLDRLNRSVAWLRAHLGTSGR
jgi:dipeptidyl aminopeptidase/acylaminoacyl peptidase